MFCLQHEIVQDEACSADSVAKSVMSISLQGLSASCQMLFIPDASTFRLVWHAPDMALTDKLHRQQWCKQ